MPPRNRKSVYTLHPSFAWLQSIEDNLPQKTGRTLAEWIAVITEADAATEGERVQWLKAEFGLGTTTAELIARRAEGRGGVDDYKPEALVDAMYAGAKSGLRSLYEHILGIALDIGPAVKASPTKTTVPLYRNNVFAQIKPTTRRRIDLGLALKHSREELPAGLIATGGLQKGDRITHRFPLTSIEDIDDTVLHWLRRAYELDS